jgi:hypothetical protein
VADGGGGGADNLELRCSAHHAYESERWFGERGHGWIDLDANGPGLDAFLGVLNAFESLFEATYGGCGRRRADRRAKRGRTPGPGRPLQRLTSVASCAIGS